MKSTNIKKMQFQQEYQNLKHKVQNEIQALEKKLSHNTEIHYHRTINGVSRPLLNPSTENEYHNSHQEDTKHNHQNHHHNHHNQSSHHHHSSHHNHSVHSMNSCCKSHHQNYCSSQKSCQCRSRKSSLSIQENSSTESLPKVNHNLTSLLQPPPHPQVNIPLVNTKILEHNIFLEQAFIKSMHNQHQMAENLRLLEEKISKLQNNSGIAQFHKDSDNNQYQWKVLSEGEENLGNGSIRKRSYKNQKMVQNDKGLVKYSFDEYSQRSNRSDRKGGQRSKSKNLYKSKSLKSNKKLSSKKLIKPITTTKPISQKSISSPTSNQYLPNNPTKISKPFKNNPNYSSLNDNKLCPIHINPTQIRLKSNQKQIYQDSEHRNRKHERNHLIESFKQQDIARKKLIDKILKASVIGANHGKVVQ